jgi:hypothetical protein
VISAAKAAVDMAMAATAAVMEDLKIIGLSLENISKSEASRQDAAT